MNIYHSNRYIEQIDKIVDALPRNDISILITGASGLIGSCIADVFIRANQKRLHKNKITVSGRDVSKLKDRFSYAEKDGLLFLEYDVMNPLSIEEDFDYIIHAASNADPVMYSLYPAETLLINVIGTKHLLEYCKNHKKTRLVFTSSFEVYGKIESQDIYDEDDSGTIDLNMIRSCYPESKRCSEILLRSYKKEYEVDFVIARLCSVYGPTMSENDSKAHAQFIRNGLIRENIVLKSKGEQIRTYAYLMDVVSGILTIMIKGKSGEAYNVANEKSIASIAEVASAIANICGTEVVYDIPSDVEKNGYSVPQNCILNNNKIRSLGWEGAYSLNDGLESTIMIMKDILSS